MFGWLRRRKARAPEDPVSAFDQAIAEHQAQGAAIRAAAATLLARRAILKREEEDAERSLDALQNKLRSASLSGDDSALSVLESDLNRAKVSKEVAQERWARVDADAAVLLERAKALTERIERLQSERAEAHSTFELERLLAATQDEGGAAVARALKLDAARDEVERAQALAQTLRAQKNKG